MQGRKGPQYVEITKPAMVVGRNQALVPPDEVELMAKIGCTDLEIAEHFGVNDQTLRRNFEEYLTKGRSELKQRLRRAQLKVAFEGNPALLIWLGKNILNQSDSPVNTDINRPLPWTDEEDDSFISEDEIEELENDDETI